MIGEHEMVTKVEDFRRRRTGLALTVSGDELRAHENEFADLLGLSSTLT